MYMCPRPGDHADWRQSPDCLPCGQGAEDLPEQAAGTEPGGLHSQHVGVAEGGRGPVCPSEGLEEGVEAV